MFEVLCNVSAVLLIETLLSKIEVECVNGGCRKKKKIEAG